MKSMPLSKYYQVINPTYAYLKIIPHSSIRNYNSSIIAKMVCNMYRAINKRISFAEKKFVYQTQVKCSYIIDIQKNAVSFYFVVPEQYVSIAKEKILTTWQKAKVERVQNIPALNQGLVYSLKYKNKDQLSLDVDRKSNYPLNSILNTIDIMESDDRVLLVYNLIPCTQYGWKAKCDKVKETFQVGNSVRRELDGKYIIFNFIYYLACFIDEVLNNLFKQENKNVFGELKDALSKNVNTLSPSSVSKVKDTILKTQIAVISNSSNKNRAYANAISVCGALEELEGDNRLESQKACIGQISLLDSTFKNIPINQFSVNECQNLLQLPGESLLQEHHIEHNNVIEIDVPEELRTGVMCLGDNTCKDTKTKAYLSTDKSFQYLTWLLIGPTRAGKTTLISNVVLDSSLKGESNIIIDFCGNCELSADLESVLKEKIKIFKIDCNDSSTLQGLGYNEQYYYGNDSFEHYRSAKQQSMQLITLVNSLQGGDEDLRARMERYLGAASLVVFISNGPIKDVFEVLQDATSRHEYIDKVPSTQQENMKKYITYLLELDDINKKDGTVGTKLNAVQGILNRISKLEQNPYIEKMLQKDCKGNINLIDEIQKGELILIKMPDGMFSTEEEKDVYATYWLTKIWGALQTRKMTIPEKKAIKVNIYFDELYQVQNCQEFLKNKLSQMAKFWAKPILSCHYLEQIKGIREELRSANASYTLIAGSDKKNYAELKSELQPFQESDLLNLKRYHAINLIKCNNGYGKFITKLPKPII